MEFKNDNLTKEDIRNTLKSMKSALELYEKEYKNKLYIYNLGSNKNLNFIIQPQMLSHLLGIDVYVNGTWLGYIGHNRPNSYDWLFEFVEAGDLIEFLLFERGENPTVNFKKILYKSQNFCDMHFKNDRVVIFRANSCKKNIGVIKENKIISFKTMPSTGKNIKYRPKSLYVYDKDLETYGPKYFKSFLVPKGLIIKYKNQEIILDDMYNAEGRNEELGKMKTFINLH